MSTGIRAHVMVGLALAAFGALWTASCKDAAQCFGAACNGVGGADGGTGATGGAGGGTGGSGNCTTDAQCSGLKCCGGFCSDLQSDPNHCGGCGTNCGNPANAAALCTAGQCSLSCVLGYADCNGVASDGCEVLLANDPDNCGSCKNACKYIDATATCAGGVCSLVSCTAGYADCDQNAANGCEVNLKNDGNNCGACGVVCPAVTNGTPACANFVCGIGSCNAGLANCVGAPTHCETDLNTDVNNCGMCGNICPMVANGTSSCASGMCAIGSCSAGFANCDGLVATGCNVQPATDVNNCGMCGNACPAPTNGVAGCTGGACGLASCNAGFANCDGNAANGCERSVLTDPMNCGGCGIICGSGSCANGVCTSCIQNVLLIADDSAAGSGVLKTALTTAGYTVTQTAVPSYQYTGANPALTNFGAVIVLAGGPQPTSFQTDMPAAGQAAIVAFLAAGNGVVFTEWAAYEVANGHWKALAPFVLLQRTESYSGQVTYTVDPAFAAHPIWSGLSPTFTFASTSNVGITQVAPNVTRIAGSPQSIDAVALRDAPAGRVVHIAHAGNYQPNGWTNTNMQTLMVNATGWVARCH